MKNRFYRVVTFETVSLTRKECFEWAVANGFQVALSLSDTAADAVIQELVLVSSSQQA